MKINYTKLSKIGREWHKDGMHRFYINYSDANELYRNELPDDRTCGQLPGNRREIGNGKIWIEMESGEICVKGFRNDDDMIECIRELIAFLGAEIVEGEETTDKEDIAMTKTYNATLINDSCIFDSADNFASIADLMIWASGRGGKYVIQIDRGLAEDGKCISLAYDSDTGIVRHFDGWEWETVPADRLAKYVRQYV